MPEHDPLPGIKMPWSIAKSSSAGFPSGATPPVAVPDHTLLRRIGKGSYGEVWLARNVLGIYRAVKIVLRSAFDNERPFEREFAGIQRFDPVSRSHESQLNILHVGRGPGCFYYIMELADDMGDALPASSAGFPNGQSKLQSGAIGKSSLQPDTYTPRNLRSELLLRGRLPVDECVRLGLALTTALAHLHRHGLVHRDIKPSNIIFVNGIPKLADIGLVAQAEAGMSFVGTEGYLPPEGPGTVQADLFSLGKVLYEIGTGNDCQQFPELPTNVGELPDRAALAEFNEVLVRACAPDVKYRYQTSAEMHADLALLQSGKSVARMRVVEHRLQFVARAGAVVTGIAVVAGLAFLYQQVQTREARHLAKENQSLAQQKTQLADEKTRLAEENRRQLVRLRVANGIREMDQGDLSSALVWLSEALALATNNPADAAIHRIRVNQLLAQHPRLLNLFPHPANVQTAEFSPDERRVVTACVDGMIRIWDTAHDEKPVAEFRQNRPVGRVRFTHDGQRLFVVQLNQLKQPATVALLDATSGMPMFPPITDLTAAMLSPDGRWLAVARTNFRVQVIATDTGQVVAEGVGHEDRVEMIGFSPDSSQLITASRDRTARRWSVSTGKPIGSPLPHDQPVSQAIFNRDGSRIATATFTEDSSGPIQFQTWDAVAGRAFGKPILGLGRNSMVSFDPSGRRLLTGDREAIARVWDADSHAAILPSLRMDRSGCSLDFSPDGASVAIGSEAGTVRIWDLEDGSLVFPPLHNSGRTESVRFNADGSQLLTASDDGTVKLWDFAFAPADHSLRIPSHARPTAAVSPDGRHLFLGVYQVPARLQLVDLQTLQADSPLPAAADFPPGGALAMDRTGSQWAVAPGPAGYRGLSRQTNEAPSTAGLWRREGGQVRYFALPHKARVREVFFHKDGSQLLTVADDYLTRIWNTADGSLRQTIRRPEMDAAWVAVSPDLRTAVALFQNEKGWHLLFRDVQTGKILGQPPENNPDINAATFSPDGTRVATVGDNQSGRIWDARTGEPATPYFKHGGTLLHIEWSPDGRRVLTAGLSSEVKVWDAATGEIALPSLLLKTRPVELAHFSADGRFIVARSDDDLVRVWDATAGEAVTPLLLHSDTVRAVFVTAAQQLVTVQNSGVVRVWNLAETPLSSRNLSDYARLLAGHFTGHSGTSSSAGAEELAALLRSLRAQNPELFVTSPDRLREWHRREAHDPNTVGQVQAAIFHLEYLARLTPEDASISEQLNRCRALLIPARDPAMPARLLDLSRAYTHSFDLLPRREFTDLPRGRQNLGGIDFDVRGLVKLDRRSDRADAVGPFHPLARIRVGQRCRTLHFLQASENEPRVEGGTVARWIIHYADGSTREWPVIYGDHLRDWWWWPQQEPLEAKQATVAWRGRAPVLNLPGSDGVRLFKASWTNPQPDLEIAELEFRNGETSMKPFVVAITAE